MCELPHLCILTSGQCQICGDESGEENGITMDGNPGDIIKEAPRDT